MVAKAGIQLRVNLNNEFSSAEIGKGSEGGGEAAMPVLVAMTSFLTFALLLLKGNWSRWKSCCR